MLTTPCVLAESIEEFCLTQDIPAYMEDEISKINTPTRSTEVFPPIIINLNTAEKLYSLKGYKEKLILRDELGKQLSVVNVPQYFLLDTGGGIEDIKLSKNGWLFIDGEYIDYVAQVNLKVTPPIITPPIELSELTNTECLPLAWIFGCMKNEGTYSQTLDRIFISNSSGSFFNWYLPSSFEIIEGKVKPLPVELKNIRRSWKRFSSSQDIIFRPIPSLKGIVFEDGITGEALFYDGNHVTSIFKPSKSNELKEKTLWWVITGAIKWEPFLIEKSPFLKVWSGKKKSYFRITSELKTIPLSLQNTFRIKKIPQLDYIFFLDIHNNTVSIEINHTLRTLFFASTPLHIGSIKYIGNQANNAIILEVSNMKTSDYNIYYIVHRSKSKYCIATLDLDKPIIFELKNKKITIK